MPIPTDAALAVQTALYGALSTDAALTALLGGARIFDHVPVKAAYPYVVVGPWRTTEPASFGAGLREHRFALTVFAHARGRKTSRAITAEVRRVLDGADLAPADHALISLSLLSTETAREQRPAIYRTTLQWRAVTEAL